MKINLSTLRVIRFLLLVFPLCIIRSSADDLETIYCRRIQRIITSSYNPQQANKWRNELTEWGNWSDVDYTAGCPARRANWPAQDHFHRIITMASSWNQQDEEADADLLQKISQALDYWFERDFIEDDCINGGGRETLNCPCGTPGLWNTNWYCQMILMPGLVGNACLVLRGNLSETQIGNCTRQTFRALDRIDGDPNGSMGPMTGANYLDVSSTGISLALLTSNESLLLNSVDRFYNESQVTIGGADGIKIDGSFMQHDSQIYNGNYGKVFMENMLKIFIETGNTSLLPPASAQSAFLTVISGSEWFMYLKNDKNDPRSPILSWQFSVIGRMVSHKYEDWNGIGLNLDDIIQGTRTWENHTAFKEIVNRLNRTSSINPGGLIGTRYFHTSDYMVHRGERYIVTLKMFSTRTTNSECNNAQNPFGFHLSDGVIYTYLTGNEYTDVYGAWDWNLIPGSTVDYGATPLSCDKVQFKGKEAFVGGVAFGEAGIAVMNYTNPLTGFFHWTKTYFFVPNAYNVQFGENVISTNKTVPIYTVLDQRQLSGPVYIDGELLTEERVSKRAQILWHDRVGYEFQYPVQLTVDTTDRQSNWSEIGISEGNETQKLFSAFFEHPLEEGSEESLTYTVHLDVDHIEFQRLNLVKQRVSIIGGGGGGGGGSISSKASATVRGISYGEIHTSDRIISLAFLTAGKYETNLDDINRVETDFPVLLLFSRNAVTGRWNVATADPSQTLSSVQINLFIESSVVPITITVQLPQGNLLGSTIVTEF